MTPFALLHFRTFALLAAALCLSGCQKDAAKSAPVSPDTTDYGEMMPLAVGNYWVYDYTVYLDTAQVSAETDTTKVAGTTEWGGFTWYYIGGDFYRNGDGGVWELSFDGNPAGSAQLFYKHPAQIGDSWTRVGDDTLTLTVESLSETVTTPGHTFTDCYCVRGDEYGQIGAATLYLKPGVGQVRTTTISYYLSLPVRSEVVLKDYFIQ